MSIDNNSWRIKQIDMNGLLGHVNLTWPLHPNVNILGGKNGSGKSTVLHALALLLNGAPTDDSTEKMIVHSAALFNSLKAEFHSGAVLSISRLVKRSVESIPDRDIDGSSSKLQRVQEEIAFNGRFTKPEGMQEIPMAKHIIYINSADFPIGMVSKLVEDSGSSNRPTKTILDFLLTRALNTRNQLFAQRMSVAMQNGNEAEVNSLRELFGRFDSAVKKFMTAYTLLDPSSLTFSPVDQPEVKIHHPSLSTGERQLLYLLLTVSNTLGQPTILLLDEADTGMHIEWKQMLLRELLQINPNMQIIAATHSPSLIDGWIPNVSEISHLTQPAL